MRNWVGAAAGAVLLAGLHDKIQADKSSEKREEKLVAILARLFAGCPPARS